jgi:uncharacterized protein YdaU (DUF1376 family)
MRLWHRRLRASSTWQRLDAAGRGIYLDLLMEAFDRDLPLPDDPGELLLMTAGTEEEWSRAWPIVGRKFSRTDDGGLVHPFVESEKAYYQGLRDAGRKGGQTGKRGLSPAQATLKHGSSGAQAGLKPPSSKKKKKKKKKKEEEEDIIQPPADPEPAQPDPPPPGRLEDSADSSTSKKPQKKNIYPADFEAWYQLYPRHEAKLAALKAWKKARPDPELRERIMRATEDQKQWPRGTGLNREREWTPLPASWLNRAQWEDEPPQKTPYRSPNQPPKAPREPKVERTDQEVQGIKNLIRKAQQNLKGSRAHGRRDDPEE